MLLNFLFYFTAQMDFKAMAVASQNGDTVCSPVVDQLNGDLIRFLAKQLLKSCIPINPEDPKLLNHCSDFNHKSHNLAYDPVPSEN